MWYFIQSIIILISIIFIIKRFNLLSLFKIAAALITLNLLLTIINPELSPLLMLDKMPLLTNEYEKIDYWTLRSQIGDVLSGHFTALAFLGLLASLLYQRDSLNQMKESLDQNNTAIKLQGDSIIQQNESLKLQINEFEQQTEEFKNQTEELSNQRKELEISKLYRQFEFYYSQLELQKDRITVKYTDKSWLGFNNLLIESDTKICYVKEEELIAILDFYQFIRNEIDKVEYDDIKKDLINFFKLYTKSLNNDFLREIVFYSKIYKQTKINHNYQEPLSYKYVRYNENSYFSLLINIDFVQKEDINSYFDMYQNHQNKIEPLKFLKMFFSHFKDKKQSYYNYTFLD